MAGANPDSSGLASYVCLLSAPVFTLSVRGTVYPRALYKEDRHEHYHDPSKRAILIAERVLAGAGCFSFHVISHFCCASQNRKLTIMKLFFMLNGEPFWYWIIFHIMPHHEKRGGASKRPPKQAGRGLKQVLQNVQAGSPRMSIQMKHVLLNRIILMVN